MKKCDNKSLVTTEKKRKYRKINEMKQIGT